MKFSGTQAQLFQAIQDGGQRFQCIGRMGFPNGAALAAGVAGLVTVGAGAALSKKVADQKQKRKARPHGRGGFPALLPRRSSGRERSLAAS